MAPSSITTRRSWVRFLSAVVAVAIAIGITLVVATSRPHSTHALGTTSAMPLMMSRVASTNVFYVLWSTSCDASPCFVLTRTDDGGLSFASVAPPPISPASGSDTGSLERLVFATADDGYAIEGTYGSSRLFATFDGGRTWHSEGLAPHTAVFDMTATASEFYAITVRCATPNATCSDYRLLRSAPGSATWSSSTIPDGALLGGTGVGLAAYGRDVWLCEQEQIVGAPSVLATSTNGGRSFTTAVHSQLIGVSGCALTATSRSSLWALTPTGMMESLNTSSDGGARWIPARLRMEMSGTGGGALDPMPDGTAYLVLGLGGNRLYRISANGRVAAVGRSPLTDYLALNFTSRADGLALGFANTETTTQYFLERTVDGGRRWSVLHL